MAIERTFSILKPDATARGLGPGGKPSVEIKSGSNAVPITMARAVREVQAATRDDALKARDQERDARVAAETAQVGAMALRFLVNLT